MFVDSLARRNPKLIEAALELHARGEIPPATFVVDLEQVDRNAGLLAERAASAGIGLYFMSKQLGRNPVIASRVAESIPSAVAVELDEALVLDRVGVRIGHLGHLVQVPSHSVDLALSLQPEVVTTFSVEKAEQLAAAARRIGREQAVLLRVRGPNDRFYAGQEGGIGIADLERAWATIDGLEGLRAVGVTSFPAFELSDREFAPTPNMETLRAAASLLGGVEQVNAPGHTSAAVLPLLRRAGATQGEPGHALTGTTPLAAQRDTEEVPACCMVTEVSHLEDDRIAVFGGAFYNRGNCLTGILDHGGTRRRLRACEFPTAAIDYYRHLRRDGATAAVGDPVLFAFRFQAFTSRAKVAAVAGVAKEQPELLGLHDGLGNPIGGSR
jgi:predicted amino acid racemase